MCIGRTAGDERRSLSFLNESDENKKRDVIPEPIVLYGLEKKLVPFTNHAKI